MRTQSRELILGPSLSGFMRRLGIAPVGCARTRLRNQMKRLFNAHIQLAYEDKQVSVSVNSPIASGTGFWWSERTPGGPGLWDSKIELGEKFFEEIIRHPVPLDMNILKAMKRSSLGIDFYLWLTYRTFTLKRPLRLSWRQLYRQFGLDSARAEDKRTADAFRTDCLRELKKIQIAWPGLIFAVDAGVLILWPSKPAVPRPRGFSSWSTPQVPFPGPESSCNGTGRHGVALGFCSKGYPQDSVILGSFPVPNT